MPTEGHIASCIFQMKSPASTPSSRLFCRVQNPIVTVKRITDGKMLGESVTAIIHGQTILPGSQNPLASVKIKSAMYSCLSW